MASKFAKRHYEEVATTVQEALKFRAINVEQQEGIRLLAGALADAFARDNSQFKRDRFMLACVPGANVRART